MTKICLVGIDGLRLDRAIDRPDPIALTLARLAAEGVRTDLEMEVPTISGPGWSSLLTGTTHAQHGIRDNSFVGSRLWEYPDLLSRAFYKNQSTRTFAAGAWRPLVDPAGPAGPVIHPRLEQQWAGKHQVMVRDGEVYGYETQDAVIAAGAVADIGALGREVYFVYLGETDIAAHVFGSIGPEYAAAIRRCDEHLARLVAAVSARADRGEDWLVVVITDHGHLDEGGHGGDSVIERSSFTIARRFGPDQTLDWPEQLAPHQLVDTLLAFVPAGAP